MPTYEYECKTCGHNFEVFQSMSDPALKDCPECGKEVRRLIFGGTGVIFKGSGFYVTDKSKGSSQAAGKANDKAKPAETGSDTAKSDAAKSESSQQTASQQGSKQDSPASEKSKPASGTSN